MSAGPLDGARGGAEGRVAREEHGRGAAPEVRGQRGEHDQHGDRDDLSGRGMVNEAPEDGLPDEQALRRLLQGAVSGLEPSPGTLDHLRRAVPARRVRKRQAVVGVAAAIVLVGTAVPALVHVASSGGVTTDQAVNAGHGSQAQGGTGSETGVEGGGRRTAAPSAGAAEPSPGGAEGVGEAAAPSAGAADGPAGGATPSGAPNGVAPCQAGQLGVTSARAEAPDSAGKVYGTFRISNVSARECVVGGAGTVGFEAHGAADRSKIAVVEHTPGDAAGGLPDPSQESPALVLPPDNAYEVRFAWVPSETCPATNPPATPSPEPTSDSGTTAGGATGATGPGSAVPADNAPGSQLGTDGAPAEGSVAVTHTAEPGGPFAQTTIPHACAGTIYRTGVLNTS